MLIFWICTACGGADVIRILKYDEEDSDKENVDPNVDPIVISNDDDDESSTMSAATAARGQAGRPWWVTGLVGDGSATSSMTAGAPSDADVFEGRVLHLRYIYQLSIKQRIRLIIKEIMQGT